MKLDPNITTIDQFISQYPPDTQAVLQEIRKTIKDAIPEAAEKINYGIPTFVLGSNVVHFSAYDTHIGFYPTPSAIVAFAADLKPYETAKGTVRFPIDKPMPLGLIRKMTIWRAEQIKNKKKS